MRVKTASQFVEQIEDNTARFFSGESTIDEHFKRNSKTWDEVRDAGLRDAVQTILRSKEGRS